MIWCVTSLTAYKPVLFQRGFKFRYLLFFGLDMVLNIWNCPVQIFVYLLLIGLAF